MTTNWTRDDVAVTMTTSPGLEGGGGPSWRSALMLCVFVFIIVGTVLGNSLVCAAVAIVRCLRTPSNLLIVSLAVSDLLVACLVMGLAAFYELNGEWSLGQQLCDMWTSLDVMLCTASILNLCAISIDRYFVITHPLQYATKRTPLRMAMMIVAVWALSALISVPALVVWKASPVEGQCYLSQDLGYQIYATVGAFYVPLTLMIVIYCRIYMVSTRLAMSESRSRGYNGRASPGGRSLSDVGTHNVLCVPLTAQSDGVCLTELGVGPGRSGDEDLNPTKNSGKRKDGATKCLDACARLRRRCRIRSRLNRISSSHDRKATKTLGVIMGAFTACWLPFFLLALVKPWCDDPQTCIPHSLNSFLLWLGYANSFLNPIIYARFNRDFRTPFKEILMGRCRGINERLRSERYAEQFGDPAGSRSHRPSVDTVVRYNCSQGYTYTKVGGGGGLSGRGPNHIPYAGQSCAVPASVQITITNIDQTS